MEILDIVDNTNTVIGQATKDDIYSKKYDHRIIHVLVKNSAGHLLLQLRSKNKRFCSGFWCTSASGHVMSGESYEAAAKRELLEEIGVFSSLILVDHYVYQDPRGMKKFIALFETLSDGLFTVAPEEVEKVDFFSLEKIKKMISDGEKLSPELLFILNQRYLKI